MATVTSPWSSTFPRGRCPRFPPQQRPRGGVLPARPQSRAAGLAKRTAWPVTVRSCPASLKTRCLSLQTAARPLARGPRTEAPTAEAGTGDASAERLPPAEATVSWPADGGGETRACVLAGGKPGQTRAPVARWVRTEEARRCPSSRLPPDKPPAAAVLLSLCGLRGGGALRPVSYIAVKERPVSKINNKIRMPKDTHVILESIQKKEFHPS